MPVRHTPESDKAEREIAHAIAEAWGVVWVKLPDFFEVDFRLEDWRSGEIDSFLETKDRKYRFANHDTVWVSERKLRGLQFVEALTGRPGFFAARYTDGVIIVAPTAAISASRRFWGGRIDRPDARNDMEWLYDVPKSACVQVLP